MKEFLHILVNFQNQNESLAFAKSCLSIRGAQLGDFIVVDNSPASSNPELWNNLQSEFQTKNANLTVVSRSDNPGYFGAAFAVEQERDLKNYRRVILSNTDLRFQDQDFYEQLSKTNWPEDVGAWATSVWSEMFQREANPIHLHRPSVLKMRKMRWIYSSFLTAWLFHVATHLDWRTKRVVSLKTGDTIYAAHGCFLVLEKRFFEKGGSFAHPVRLYGEEINLAEQLIRLGLRMTVKMDLQISHREKGTESSWWNRHTLSHKTFLAKKQAAQYLEQLLAKPFDQIANSKSGKR